MTATVTRLPPPADTVAMRATADLLLASDTGTPSDQELPALIRRLREHIELLAPAVEELIRPDARHVAPRPPLNAAPPSGCTRSGAEHAAGGTPSVRRQ
ncbi:DUF6415 family natural product biosynthesis protein [Streptomyces sp. NPDC050546]|uniref:DUF6415 family natural product biosynthesis protein n=1 Tax=Streptomyces sp. NPDC050546 TaxID=3365628 RepID=UPI0037A7C7E1